MGLFAQVIDTLPAVTVSDLTQPTRIPLQRDFPREGFVLRIDVAVAGGTGLTAFSRPGALPLNAISRVSLQANDGGQQRVIVDAMPISLLTRWTRQNGQIDQSTAALLAATTAPVGTSTFYIPFCFAPGNLDSPVRDMFLQNFPRFNSDPNLTISWNALSSFATVSEGATVTYTVTVIDLKRRVSVDNWNFLATEFIDNTVVYSGAAARQEYFLPIPGYHFSFGVIPYNASYSALAPATFSTTVPQQIRTLNTSDRTFFFNDDAARGAFSMFAPVTAGNASQANYSTIFAAGNLWIDYLTDLTGASALNLDTVLNTYPFTQLGTGPKFMYDVTTAANIVFVHDRCFGNIAGALALAKK